MQVRSSSFYEYETNVKARKWNSLVIKTSSWNLNKIKFQLDFTTGTFIAATALSELGIGKAAAQNTLLGRVWNSGRLLHSYCAGYASNLSKIYL